MAWIERHAIGIASAMRSHRLPALVGCGLGIVAAMAERLKVPPVQPALGCCADLNDVIHVLSPTTTAST
jgi:hypothetical protein